VQVLDTCKNVSVKIFEKVKFSMFVPEVEKVLIDLQIKSVILVGIEAHVCVFQTTLDLLERGYEVHVVADGVSSQRSYDRKTALKVRS
jgi:nicotinamidase-related amidase